MMKDLEMLRELSLAERVWLDCIGCGAPWPISNWPLGLTHPRWTALWKLSRLGGHLSQKTLAEALEIELPPDAHPGPAGRAGAGGAPLLQSGQAGPHRHPDPRKQALLDQIEDRIMEIRRELLAGISQRELEQFEDIVHRICANALGKIGAQSEERE